MTNYTGKHVLVTTSHRGVFFGRLASIESDVATLTGARNCVYWDRSAHGFLGLATAGPSTSCRVGPAAPETTLHGVTSVSVCTSEAVLRWEAAPWSS